MWNHYFQMNKWWVKEFWWIKQNFFSRIIFLNMKKLSTKHVRWRTINDRYFFLFKCVFGAQFEIYLCSLEEWWSPEKQKSNIKKRGQVFNLNFFFVAFPSKKSRCVILLLLSLWHLNSWDIWLPPHCQKKIHLVNNVSAIKKKILTTTTLTVWT